MVDYAIDSLEQGSRDSERIHELELALWEVSQKLRLAGEKLPKASALWLFLADARSDALRCLRGGKVDEDFIGDSREGTEKAEGHSADAGRPLDAVQGGLRGSM